MWRSVWLGLVVWCRYSSLASADGASSFSHFSSSVVAYVVDLLLLLLFFNQCFVRLKRRCAKPRTSSFVGLNTISRAVFSSSNLHNMLSRWFMFLLSSHLYQVFTARAGVEYTWRFHHLGRSAKTLDPGRNQDRSGADKTCIFELDLRSNEPNYTQKWRRTTKTMEAFHSLLHTPRAVGYRSVLVCGKLHVYKPN